MTLEDEIQWTVTEAIRRDVHDVYERIRNSLPSCKKHMYESGHIYDDCNLEKANYSLEYALEASKC